MSTGAAFPEPLKSKVEFIYQGSSLEIYLEHLPLLDHNQGRS